MSSLELPQFTIVRGSRPDSPVADRDLGWERRFDRQGRVCAYTRPAEGGGWLYLPGLAGYRFAAGGAHVQAFPEPGAPADAIVEGYHRVALPMALQAAGHEVLHASAVSDARGVHVICGASRAGKSTIAYALGRRGFEVWADDAVAFRAHDGAITTVPLPFALRLRSEVADFFEEPGHVGPSANGKIEALRRQAGGPQTIASLSLLERGSARSISRLSPHESLPAVLYHSFYFSLDDPSVRQRMTTQILDLIAHVSVFRVLRAGLDEVDGLLDDLEQRVFARAEPPPSGWHNGYS